MRIRVANTDAMKRSTYRMRHEVMSVELGWIDAQETTIPEEMDEYDAMQTTAFIAFDENGTEVGTARVIHQGDIPLPIERHFNLYPEELIHARHGRIQVFAEASRFIVPKHDFFKPHEVSIPLAHHVIEYCKGEGCSHLLCSMDYRFYRLLRMKGFPFEQIGDIEFYMGSDTVPCILSLTDPSARVHVQPDRAELATTK